CVEDDAGELAFGAPVRFASALALRLLALRVGTRRRVLAGLCDRRAVGGGVGLTICRRDRVGETARGLGWPRGGCRHCAARAGRRTGSGRSGRPRRVASPRSTRRGRAARATLAPSPWSASPTRDRARRSNAPACASG